VDIDRQAALQECDALLEVIEQAMLDGLHRARLPTDLRARLVDLALAVRYDKAIPSNHRDSHHWVLDLQGARLLTGHGAAGKGGPSRRSKRPSPRRSLYHRARVQESLRRDPEWAFYAWQAAVDNAKRWPSPEAVQLMLDAWSHYWDVIQGAEDCLRRRVA
jgi:hypothetical protein